jgi:hypothetical protein
VNLVLAVVWIPACRVMASYPYPANEGLQVVQDHGSQPEVYHGGDGSLEAVKGNGAFPACPNSPR